MNNSNRYETDLDAIAAAAIENEEENDHFLRFIRRQDGTAMDALVHEVNERVSEAIDCTACGNCCSRLMINVTQDEVGQLSDYLSRPASEVKQAYIEESQGGNCYINTIPCHFLAHSKCTIYPARFTECRDFPHLHKPGFRERLLGTLLHYGVCPIIYNVVEEVKHRTGFYTS